MRENGTGADGGAVPKNEVPEDSRALLDEELNSAASPFLYLLASIVVAVAAYFLYALLHG